MSNVAYLLGLSCLTSWFSALLPPEHEDDQDYYTVMGLENRGKSATADDIKKAYKTKSLQLHPDKIAQRGGNVEEASAEYLKVQEANSVLANPQHRSLYHALGCSPTRYKFVSTGAWHNPTALHDNLVQSSFAAKSRIVLVICVLLVMVLLQPILIVVKINHVLEGDGALEDTLWTVILIPWWISQGLYVVLWMLIWYATKTNSAQQDQPQDFASHLALITVCEQVCWLTWEVLLAIRWDETVDWNYVDIFVPFYLVILLRIYHSLVTMRKIRLDCRCMVSMEYLEREILATHQQYQDLSPEEMTRLQQEYIVIHSADTNHPLEFAESMSEEDMEEARVHSSVEFQQAMEVYYQAFTKMVQTVLFWIPFCVLVVLRLDDHIDVSWWVVFVPLWVHLGWQVVSNTYVCCCASVAGEEIVIGAHEEEEDDEDESPQQEDDDKVETPKKARDVTESGTAAMFASAEQDMDKFNNEMPSQFVSEANESEQGTSATASDKETPEELDTSTTPHEEEKMADVVDLYSPSEQDQSASPKTREPASPDNPDDNKNDDDEEFHIDPEMFEAWQSAQEQAESSAMEEQAKAWGSCCLASFELIILCLLVGKLDESYQQSELDGDDVGYSAVWIIFPILLVAGMVLCCCACVIYGSKKSDPSAEQDATTPPATTDTTTKTEGDGEPTATTKPPEEPTTADEEQGAYESHDID